MQHPKKTPKNLKEDPSHQFSLYIHWPYCLKRCPYCDFNAHIAQSPKNSDDMADALIRELTNYRQKEIFLDYFDKKTIKTIFFGGGTPSLMPPSLIEKLLQTAEQIYGFASDIEITMEANPSSLEGGEHLKNFRTAGINRLSMGVQSLQDESLQKLGRIHDSKTAIKIIETLPKIFSRWSCDLIYSRPNQTIKQWLNELQLALSFRPHHLSLYQLTIERGTEYHRMVKQKNLTMPDDDLSADMFIATRNTMAQHHLPPYEISNYAYEGHESRHNLHYWHYGDWLGIGAGAEGRLTHHKNTQQGREYVKYATKNFRLPKKWAKSVHKNNIGLESLSTIDKKNAMIEKMMMGLRLTKGIELLPEHLPKNFTIHWQNLVDNKLAMPATQHHYCLSESGLLRLNSVIAYLIS
ncbi:MAG: radical SAM family heme chaperone HemW [Alphaproteobacteria bacterium]